MNPKQIALVQDSFKQVPADAAADIFYERLFGMAPELRGMFPEDLKEQKRKLVTMLAAVVRGLSDLDSILGLVEDLGMRHADYGVKPGHYEVVGGALIWTLRNGLGDSFTKDVENAWAEAYGTLASVMIDAARLKAA